MWLRSMIAVILPTVSPFLAARKQAASACWKKGIEGLLYLESFKAALKKGYERAEMSWILEENVLVQRGCELMGGRLYKKYRIYEKRIS